MIHTTVIRKREHHRFIQFDSLDAVDTFGYTEVYKSSTASKSSHGGQISRTGISSASAQEQDLTEGPFMSLRLSVREKSQYPLMI